MADVKSLDRTPASSLLTLSEPMLRQGIELLFFAYRDFVSEADDALAEIGFGRAHHRVLHFVGRSPGMTVGALLGILRITKQSLSRVLNQLIAEGYVERAEGTKDRRQRLLNLTEKGRALEAKLFEMQRTRIVKAFRDAGPDAVAGYRRVLKGLITEENRASILKTIERP